MGNLGDLRNDEQSSWLKMRDGIEIHVKFLAPDELANIRKRATKPVFIKNVQMDQVDDKEADRLIGRACVLDWRNIQLGKEELAYSPENCDLLMKKSYEFANFVGSVANDIKKFIERQEEGLGKSETMPSGGSQESSTDTVKPAESLDKT